MIAADNVTFRYPGDENAAVGGVSVTVAPGETVGIVGPNGSGKSTLGRLLKGLLLPDAGSIQVDGLDSERDGIEVRKTVGLVFQNPNSQIVNAVVEHEIAFGPENLGLAPAEIRDRVSEALGAVQLTGQEAAECHMLTMANKQRVAIGSVLAMRPRYLILDEATAWIEPSARWRILEAVRRWASEREAGLIFITHRMDEAQLCDRLYGMLDGEVIAEGGPSEILGESSVRERLALAIPEVYALTKELRHAGLPVIPGSSLDQVAETLCPS